MLLEYQNILKNNFDIDTFLKTTNQQIGAVLRKIGKQSLGEYDYEGDLHGAGLSVKKDQGKFNMQIGNFKHGKLDGMGILILETGEVHQG